MGMKESMVPLSPSPPPHPHHPQHMIHSFIPFTSSHLYHPNHMVRSFIPFTPSILGSTCTNPPSPGSFFHPLHLFKPPSTRSIPSPLSQFHFYKHSFDLHWLGSQLNPPRRKKHAIPKQPEAWKMISAYRSRAPRWLERKAATWLPSDAHAHPTHNILYAAIDRV